MDSQTTTDPLAELGLRIYDKATEARREYESLRNGGQYHKAALVAARIAALVEVGNDLDRTRGEAASVEKPSPVVRSGAWVGTGAGQTLDRPSAAGWWWWRNNCGWHMVEVNSCRSGLFCCGLNMGDESVRVYRRWLGEWAGPVMPPPVPTDQSSATREEMP